VRSVSFLAASLLRLGKYLFKVKAIFVISWAPIVDKCISFSKTQPFSNQTVKRYFSDSNIGSNIESFYILQHNFFLVK
jgi:hypothetical protein